jgi:Leucine-rich repeat (LRR) protein
LLVELELLADFFTATSILLLLDSSLIRMTALRNLSANGTAIKKLPPSFGGLRDLESVYLSGCGGPSSSWILKSLLSIRSLSQLDLSGHNLSEGDIPKKFACSSSLSTLNLSRNNFRNLPDCIRRLPGLLNLYLNECTILQSISVPVGPVGVYFLEANDCTSLETISVSKNESPRCFHLNNCPKLVKISLENLRPDSEVFMARCNNLSPEFRERVLQVLSLSHSHSLSLSLVL